MQSASIPPHPMRKRGRMKAAITGALSVATVAVSLAAMPTAASAGTYHVYQCGDVVRMEAGGQFGYLPYTDGDYGFQAGGTAGSGARLDACGGASWAMNAELTGGWTQPTGAYTRWRWVAPPDTTIDGMQTLYRYETADFRGDTGTSGSVWISHSKQTDPSYIMRANRPGPQGPGVLSDYQYAATTIPNAAWLDFVAGCDGVSLGRTCPTQGHSTAQLLVYGLHLALNDAVSPTASSVTGSVADNRYWRGVESLTVAASDRGSGIFKVIVQQRNSDGNWVDRSSQTLNANGGKCSSPSPSGFLYAHPCPDSASADVDFDTRAIAEGDSQWRVQVSDAADNRTTVSAPQSRIIDRTNPQVSFADTADSCTAGSRTLVQGTATDALSGIQSVTTLVVNAAGARLPVAADGTIECPPVAQGPLAVTTTATDRAGNSESVTRSRTVAVSAPDTPVTTDPGKDPVGGGNETQQPNTGKPAETTPAPTAPPVAQPTVPAPVPAPDKTVGARLLFKCSVNKDIVLTEASPSGSKDLVRGVAAPQYAGQTVTITYGPKRQVVAKLPVGIDGTFQTMVKAPKGKTARSNAARYQATVGKKKSAALKRVRRMYSTLTYRTATGNAIYVSGRLTKPYPKGTTVTVRLSGSGCGQGKAVKKLKVDARGYYGDSISVDTRQDAYIVRVTANVKASAKSHRTFGTATLPVPVQMKQ